MRWWAKWAGGLMRYLRGGLVGWWAHADGADMRLVGSCADGLVGWWAHADMRWWASGLVGSWYALVG